MRGKFLAQGNNRSLWYNWAYDWHITHQTLQPLCHAAPLSLLLTEYLHIMVCCVFVTSYTLFTLLCAAVMLVVFPDTSYFCFHLMTNVFFLHDKTPLSLKLLVWKCQIVFIPDAWGLVSVIQKFAYIMIRCLIHVTSSSLPSVTSQLIWIQIRPVINTSNTS